MSLKLFLRLLFYLLKFISFSLSLLLHVSYVALNSRNLIVDSLNCYILSEKLKRRCDHLQAGLALHAIETEDT